MQLNNVKKIVVIGPESTGKSSLCQQLAAHYNTIWCKEYAREYLLKNGKQYSYEDLLYIAQGQIELEDKCAAKLVNTNLPLIIDTDMYVMKVWCEYVYNQCHQYILNQIANRHYDLYLLCDIDLPWIADELREYPNEEPRKELFAIYKDLLINQNTPWAIINGKNEERLTNAISFIDENG